MPLAYMAITRHPDHKDLIGSYEKDGNKFYILQVKILAKHFLESIDFLEEKIASAREKDAEFISRFYRRLMSQELKYLQSNKSLLQKAEKNLTNNLAQSNERYTTTSGTKTQTTNKKTTYTS